MDMGKYMGVFVAECRELIESLNLSIVQLERDPDGAATIDEIFRVAHSFKGISSTMGYERMAGLTHHMEHLLDIVRAGGRAVDQDLITVLLGCLDVLEGAVDNIEQDGDEAIDPTALIAQLEELAEGTDAGGAPPSGGADAVASQAAELPDPATLPEGIELLHVAIDIVEGCDATSIRAFMAYTAIDSSSELVWSVPAADDLDDWEIPRLDLLVAHEGESIEEDLLRALERIPELSSVQLNPYPGTGATAASEGETAPAAEMAIEPVAVEPVPAASVVAPDVAEAASASSAANVRQRKSGTVRVDAERLDALMHLMGEVVVHRSAVEARIRDRDMEGATAAVQELRRSTQSLQAEVMNVRMVPVESALMRMPRLVRDLSAKLNKEVDLVITGADTEIDRSVVDALGDPLVHLVRNALDHGIEPPDEREAAGKPRTATLGIGAQHAGGNVLITVTDDGRGIDPERVKTRAVERGIISVEEAQAMSHQDAVELVFRAGFSTAEVATDVSGRGVGMDAVRAMCREWGGDVDIESTFGVGSVARIRIPLTLAVMTVLVVRAGMSNVAIPIDRIERTIRLSDSPRAELAPGQRMIHLDEGVLAEVDLGGAVGYGRDDESVFGVIVHGAGGRRVVLAVRGLVGEHEAVTKPLPPELGREATFMGAAVQGDGSVVLIVDCDQLVEGGARTVIAGDVPVLIGHDNQGGPIDG